MQAINRERCSFDLERTGETECEAIQPATLSPSKCSARKLSGCRQTRQTQNLHGLNSKSENYLGESVPRIFDVCFSIGVLILTALLFALVAIMIRVTPPGPIFFAQERIGLNGKPFRMYKFRSMRVGPASEVTLNGQPPQTRAKPVLGPSCARPAWTSCPSS